MSKPSKTIINVIFAIVIALGAFDLGIRYDGINHTKLLRENSKTIDNRQKMKLERDAYLREIYMMGIHDGVISTLQVPFDRIDKDCYEYLLGGNINPSYSYFYDRFEEKWFAFLRENGYCDTSPLPADSIEIDTVH